MKPTELKGHMIKLPNHLNHNIILITGNSPRHRRFALRMQKEFPKLIVAWYGIDKSIKAEFNKYSIQSNKNTIKSNKVIKMMNLFLRWSKIFLKNPNLKKVFQKINSYIIIKKYYLEHHETEKQTFNPEIRFLEKFSTIKEQKINPKDVNTSEFSQILRELNAYFLLSLGGPLLKAEIIKSVKGIALNQHAGHSPNYRGSGTTEWALYHRDIHSVSNTVHITTTSADSGPIVRRSNICIHSDDSPQILFHKVVALGTELMIEVVKEIIGSKTIMVFDQPNTIGKTYLQKELSNDILISIINDFRNGWLRQVLNKSF